MKLIPLVIPRTSLEQFLEMLKSFQIETIADIRSLPGSRRFPQFNKEELVHTGTDI